jgi:hypothetical protein
MSVYSGTLQLYCLLADNRLLEKICSGVEASINDSATL